MPTLPRTTHWRVRTQYSTQSYVMQSILALLSSGYRTLLQLGCISQWRTMSTRRRVSQWIRRCILSRHAIDMLMCCIGRLIRRLFTKRRNLAIIVRVTTPLCANGGIGRRVSLRGWCPSGRGGSSPLSRTIISRVIPVIALLFLSRLPLKLPLISVTIHLKEARQKWAYFYDRP